MNTIRNESSETFREKGSKFIGFLFPASNTDLFEERLKQIQSKHPGATHHCYAYRINPTNLLEFAQDDGEPNGTAGLPILNQLKSYDVANVGLVVVRYFGGTKLGKSGLIEAYGRSAILCLEKVPMKKIAPYKIIEVQYPYNQQNFIDHLKNSYSLREIDAQYLEEVTLTLACPENRFEACSEELTKAEHLNIHFDYLRKDFLGV